MLCGYLGELNQANCKIALLLLFTSCEAQQYTGIHHCLPWLLVNLWDSNIKDHCSALEYCYAYCPHLPIEVYTAQNKK
jgi:hypothetical protein